MLSDKYIDEIVSWNKKFNLTGLKNKEEIKEKLYNDSLSIAKVANLSKKLKVIDVGCGAGFPGIPLKIEYPNIELTLIDSINKKIEFVKHVIELLNLEHAEAICIRAEDLAHDNRYREQFDLVISRAVAKLNTLYEYCLPFSKVGGLFVAQKGPDIDEEIKSAGNALEILGGRLKEPIRIPSGYLVVIEKAKSTPPGYPRRTGTAAKKPL